MEFLEIFCNKIKQYYLCCYLPCSPLFLPQITGGVGFPGLVTKKESSEHWVLASISVPSVAPPTIPFKCLPNKYGEKCYFLKNELLFIRSQNKLANSFSWSRWTRYFKWNKIQPIDIENKS